MAPVSARATGSHRELWELLGEEENYRIDKVSDKVAGAAFARRGEGVV